MSSIALSIMSQFKFNFERPPQHLKCVICRNIIINAIQTSCGCKTCKKCIENYLKDGAKQCPSGPVECSNTILDIKVDIYQDIATNKEIYNLKVKCPFEKCLFMDILKNMEMHIKICENKEEICNKCSQKFLSNKKADHMEKNCIMRDVKCVYCNELMSQEYLTNIHLNLDSEQLCSKINGICPNKCSKNHFSDLKDHLNDCESKPIKCPFNHLLCKVDKMPKKHLPKHFEEESFNHTMSLLSSMGTLQSKMENFDSESKPLKIMIKELSVMKEKSDKSYSKLFNTINELRSQNSAGATYKSETIVFRNGQYIWKVTNFPQRKLEAERGESLSIISEPFYTSEFGYKMCLKIYPAGDGLCKGTHLSIFFVLMRGEFDDFLMWPFKQKVNISVLDVKNSLNHISDKFKPDPKLQCYTKPKEEFNIASESPKFIPFNVLFTDQYMKNDNIYLKIVVDT